VRIRQCLTGIRVEEMQLASLAREVRLCVLRWQAVSFMDLAILGGEGQFG
jgi:hypothetical protein